MNREEASFILANIDRRVCDDELNEALDMAVKALEQEPCGEAISREDALMCLTGEWTEITDEIIHRFIKRIKALPPVNPQPKTGHWIVDRDDSRRWDKVRFYCSECGKWQTYGKTDYCPSCGAKMIEPQESEE